MTESPEIDTSLDAFVLFNRLEGEELSRLISQLESRGIRTFFERRDVDINDRDANQKQDAAREQAQTVLILMGPEGWGPLHREYSLIAVKEKKPIVIGLMKGGTRKMVESELPGAENFLTFDLTSPNGIEALVVALGGTPSQPEEANEPPSGFGSSPSQQPESKSDDVFMLGYGSDRRIADIASGLRSRGLTVFFDQGSTGSDTPSDAYRQRFFDASVILVLIGTDDWNPNQQSYVKMALAKIRPVILVEFNAVTDEIIAQAVPELVRVPRVSILNVDEPAPVDQLFEVIQRESAPLPPIEEDFQAIDRLATGREDERSIVLAEICAYSGVHRARIATFLAERIDTYLSSNPPTKSVGTTTITEASRSTGWLISALTESNAESVASRRILEACGRDGSDTIRYWTLAGLHKVNASYKKVVAQESLGYPNLELQFLAQAILGELEIESLRRLLSGTDIADERVVLRVLRVFAIPELANDVCEVVGKLNLTSNWNRVYDALYAISLPEMAKASADYWRPKKRLSTITRLIVFLGKPDRKKLLRRLSRILAPLPLNDVKENLERLRANDADTVGYLLSLLDPATPVPNIKYIPNVGSDTLGEFDRLGIETDVETLSAVIAAKSVHAPLAIGLFGAWGSGKSFFMKQMKKSIKRRADEATTDTQSPFYSRIETVDFNAWHYYDTNLWASLINNIFEQLDDCVSPRVTKKEQIEEKKNQIDEAKQQVQKATTEQANLTTQLAEAEKNLSTEKQKRQENTRSIEDLGLPDLRVLVMKNPELVAQAEKYIKASGALDVMSSLAGLKSTLNDALSTGKKIKAFFKAIWDEKKGRGLLIVWMAIALVGGATMLFVFQKYVLPIIGTFSVASIAAYLVSVNTFLKGNLKKVKDHFAQLENANNDIKALLAAEQNKPTKDELNLESSVVALRKQVQEAETRVEKSKQVVSALESEVEAIVKANSLRSFLSNRRDADDYIKHLGLMSTIRKDLKELETRVSNIDDDGARIERIVLFIDDLDRCPTEKVLEVLQAVHLLLAFELFVVVVGVDPKWLMHSLSENYTQFQAKTNKPNEAHDDDSQDSDNGEWHTRPRDFLEKIFQIPFRLNAMTPAGFGDLVSDLFSDDKSNGVTDEEILLRQKDMSETSQKGSRLESIEQEKPNSVSEKTDEQPETSSKASESLQPQGSEVSTNMDTPRVIIQAQIQTPAPVRILDAALMVKPHEIEFSKKLSSLITNPRAVKRFTNVYRILKAPLTRAEIESFEGTKEHPGQFQAVMLILAILVGSSDFAAETLPQLNNALDEKTSLNTFFTKYFENPDSKGLEFKDVILPIIKNRHFPKDSAFLKTWLPKVCRFSFETGQLIN